MKKNLLFVLMLAFSASIFALSPTAVINVKIASDLGYNDNVTLVEDASYSSALDAGADMQKNYTITNPSQNVVFYALTEFTTYAKASMLATNSLNGVKLGFITNTAETNYTITFPTVTGTTYYLLDKALMKSTKITSTASYPFTATVGSTIEDRFEIIAYAYQVTTNEEGWASFACADIVTPVESGLTMYRGVKGEDVLTLYNDFSNVPAGAGIIVKGEAATTYHFSVVSSATALTANDLIGCPTATTAAAGTNFVLSYQNSQTAFYQYTGTTIPAGKAYLNFPASSPAPKRIRMVVGGAQGVENVEAAVKSEKLIRDGQIVIIRNGVEYNAAGQIIK